MKTFAKSTIGALLVAMSVSVSSFAVDDDLTQKKSFGVAMFPAADPSKLWMCLEKYKPGSKIELQLTNEKGEVMFREVLPAKGGKKNGFRQQFDLSQIGDGRYTFRISDGIQTEERTFKLSTPTIRETLPSRQITMN
ncbi:hypothetical protein DYU11_16300 [Fibrisoma montanum]|uniref:T9SS C-terminal target domain-containing protein n=1 Tax=Fibrisoma montanum TaxID=2305895 RepID=A0A418M900_9BACT|nr:hypothetical protein [Fibrisoma montanum]RIV22572.1 hypothetical protein DYU11_16300 [Fibrisoma montanum]